MCHINAGAQRRQNRARVLLQGHQCRRSADQLVHRKSYLSALFRSLEAEGHIPSLEDPVIKYKATMAGGAYNKATIRNVLQVSSGITFSEDYQKDKSDINRMGRVHAIDKKMGDFVADLTKTFAPPGQI
jgi:CubicO group peptidase (beta-lactamase class C family)